MPLYQAIILAIVQGLTEFLPVSSTAHLAIIPRLFRFADPGLGFDVALHVGTLVAILIFFFRDWVQVIAHGFGFSYRGVQPDENSRSLLWFLITATVPLLITGALLKEYAEGPWRTLFVMGTALVLLGLLMGVADRSGENKRGLDSLTWTDALTIGFAQALAVVPGVSRSGITITAARWRQLDRASAARFSFLLSTPAIAAAAAKDALDLRKQGGVPPDMQLPYLVGILVSALVGIVIISFFLHYLKRNTLRLFIWYRVIFGIMVIALGIFFRNGG